MLLLLLLLPSRLLLLTTGTCMYIAVGIHTYIWIYMWKYECVCSFVYFGWSRWALRTQIHKPIVLRSRPYIRMSVSMYACRLLEPLTWNFVQAGISNRERIWHVYTLLYTNMDQHIQIYFYIRTHVWIYLYITTWEHVRTPYTSATKLVDRLCWFQRAHQHYRFLFLNLFSTFLHMLLLLPFHHNHNPAARKSLHGCLAFLKSRKLCGVEIESE